MDSARLRRVVRPFADPLGGKRAFIVLRTEQGRSPEQIIADYRRLTHGDVYAALTYYHDNRALSSSIASLKAHTEVFLDCLRNRHRPPADVEVGHLSSNPGHLMNIAWRYGRTITWDAEKEVVVGDEDADDLVTKPYRAPWSLDA